MAEANAGTQYDDILSTILTNEQSILGFLSTIFNFLRRRTDFYFVPEGPNDNLGFPPGEAEKLVIKILRNCDPKNLMADNNNTSSGDIYDAIMCSTVAQEVEIGEEVDTSEPVDVDPPSAAKESVDVDKNVEKIPPSNISDTVPHLPPPMRSECYNGAERENYVWAQSIVDLDVTVKLPEDVKSSKDIKVTINPGDLIVLKKCGDVIIKDTFPHKVKAIESFWSISGQQLMIHLEKHDERWWKSLLSSEEEIDITKIDSSRQLYDLPESHIAKIHEMQWNQEQKLKGLPTSDEIKNMEILKKAWNVEGSPFKGTEFDPSVFRSN